MSRAAEKMAQLARLTGASGADARTVQEAVKTETHKAVKTVKLPRRALQPAKARGLIAQPLTSDLKQMTIKLGPEVRQRLLAETVKRKAANVPNWAIQAIITEALDSYLPR